MSTPTNHQSLKSFAENTIVAFHIGRGGHFHNPGHLTYLGEHKISKYVDDLFLNYDVFDVVRKLEDQHEDWAEGDTGVNAKIIITKKDLFYALVNDEKFYELEKRFGIKEEELGEKYYFDGGGNHVGLTEKEAETGIGTINIDQDYDTTYAQKLSDCSEKEIQLIWNAEKNGYLPDETLLSYLRWMLDIEEEEIEEDAE